MEIAILVQDFLVLEQEHVHQVLVLLHVELVAQEVVYQDALQDVLVLVLLPVEVAVKVAVMVVQAAVEVPAEVVQGVQETVLPALELVKTIVRINVLQLALETVEVLVVVQEDV